MDPNAALAEIREITRKWDSGEISPGYAWESMDELCERVNGLDEWLSRGGFLPDAWQNNRA